MLRYYFRLEAYDRNQDFGGQEDLGEEFSMSLPDVSTYKNTTNANTFDKTFLLQYHIVVFRIHWNIERRLEF